MGITARDPPWNMRRRRPRAPGHLDVVDVLVVEDHDEVDDVAPAEMRQILHDLALEAMA